MTEFRLHAKQRRRTADDVAHHRRGVQTRGRTDPVPLRLGFIHEYQHDIFGIVDRETGDECVETNILGVAAVDDLLSRARFTTHIIAFDLSPPAGTFF